MTISRITPQAKEVQMTMKMYLALNYTLRTKHPLKGRTCNVHKTTLHNSNTLYDINNTKSKTTLHIVIHYMI